MPKVITLKDPKRPLGKRLQRRVREAKPWNQMARKYPMAKVGDRFGRWTVIAYWLPDVNQNNTRRICVRCDCGYWRVHWEVLVVSGKTKSCGCAVRSAFGGRSTQRVAQERERREAEVMAKVDALVIDIRREGEGKENESRDSPAGGDFAAGTPSMGAVA